MIQPRIRLLSPVRSGGRVLGQSAHDFRRVGRKDRCRFRKSRNSVGVATEANLDNQFRCFGGPAPKLLSAFAVDASVFPTPKRAQVEPQCSSARTPKRAARFSKQRGLRPPALRNGRRSSTAAQRPTRAGDLTILDSVLSRATAELSSVVSNAAAEATRVTGASRHHCDTPAAGSVSPNQLSIDVDQCV